MKTEITLALAALLISNFAIADGSKVKSVETPRTNTEVPHAKQDSGAKGANEIPHAKQDSGAKGANEIPRVKSDSGSKSMEIPRAKSGN